MGLDRVVSWIRIVRFVLVLGLGVLVMGCGGVPPIPPQPVGAPFAESMFGASNATDQNDGIIRVPLDSSLDVRRSDSSAFPAFSQGDRYAASDHHEKKSHKTNSYKTNKSEAVSVPETKLMAQEASSGAPRSVRYVVRDGDTLYALAHRYGIGLQELVEHNRLSPSYSIRVGQVLFIPVRDVTSGVRKSVEPRSTVEKPPSRPDQEERRIAAARSRVIKPMTIVPPLLSNRERKAISNRESKAVSNRESKETQKFRWPVRGRILSGFGSHPGGVQNDGINIAIPEGTSIRAAESGVVAYVGNELKGYGNLVLIRHSQGWVTAYAHNSRIIVKRGDWVQRGQVISKAGQTGNVGEPQLHFEIRKGSKPIDPMSRLDNS